MAYVKSEPREEENISKILSEIPVERLKEMINSGHPELAEGGIQMALTMLRTQPEKFAEDLWAPVATSAWDHEDLQRMVEETFAHVAKGTPHCVPINVLRELSEERCWYVRWLTLWTLNSLSFSAPSLVPVDILEKLTRDEMWWNRVFAWAILNRVKTFKTGPLQAKNQK